MAYAMLAIVAVLSLIPVSNVDIQVSDKAMHFVVYFGLSAGFMVLLQQHSNIKWIVGGLVIYGIVLEILQGMTGYRYMEGLDVVANSLGVLAGVLVRFSPLPVLFRRIESRF